VNALVRIWAIATNTLREAVRNRLLYALLFFAILLILSGIFLSTLSYVDSERILQDIGFGAIRLFGVAIAIFVGVGLIYKEVDRRTVYTILSKPISRAEFLIGKFVGLVLAIWMQMAIMVAVFAGVSLATGAPFGAAHVAAFVLLALELALVVALATFFSAFTSPMLASLFASGLWFAGSLSRNLRDLGAQASLPSVHELTRVLFWLLPDLDAFNLSIEAAHGLPVPLPDVWLAVAYGIGYIAIVLVGAVLVFESRDMR
jgi:ABC-type transport system involved in multi-copper enzyme maturation permease subunit